MPIPAGYVPKVGDKYRVKRSDNGQDFGVAVAIHQITENYFTYFCQGWKNEELGHNGDSTQPMPLMYHGGCWHIHSKSLRKGCGPYYHYDYTPIPKVKVKW